MSVGSLAFPLWSRLAFSRRWRRRCACLRRSRRLGNHRRRLTVCHSAHRSLQQPRLQHQLSPTGCAHDSGRISCDVPQRCVQKRRARQRVSHLERGDGILRRQALVHFCVADLTQARHIKIVGRVKQSVELAHRQARRLTTRDDVGVHESQHALECCSVHTLGDVQLARLRHARSAAGCEGPPKRRAQRRRAQRHDEAVRPDALAGSLEDQVSTVRKLGTRRWLSSGD